jgi:hypothetical protein
LLKDPGNADYDIAENDALSLKRAVFHREGKHVRNGIFTSKTGIHVPHGGGVDEQYAKFGFRVPEQEKCLV